MPCKIIEITLEGTPLERGTTYGTKAKEAIIENLAFYKDFFENYAKIKWEKAKEFAMQSLPIIEKVDPEYVEEMQGVAKGAGVDFKDILTLNCRSEVVFGRPDGCTVVGFVPELTKNGHTLMGQTWDWLIPAKQFVCVLKVKESNGLTSLFVAEAGILGGKGINSAGIGVLLNAMSIGKGEKGVPLHLFYRKILQSRKITDAIDVISQNPRAGAGTLTIGSSEGFMFAVEYTPYNFDVLMAEDRALVHTNHYLSPLFIGEDKFKFTLTDTFVRYNTLRRKTRHMKKATIKEIFKILASHENYPDSVCSHEDPLDPQYSRFCTIYGIAMDLNERKLWLSNGNPCEKGFKHYSVEK